MKVCFFTLGTLGDVQPYVALGKELVKEGHKAVICVGESFRQFIESNGIDFVPTTSDLMLIATSPEGKAILEHPLKNLRLALRYSKEIINPAYRKTLEEFYAAESDADVIIYHPKALGSVDIALKLGIPCICMPPVPVTYPIIEFANLAVTTKNLGRLLNKATYRINVTLENENAAAEFAKERLRISDVTHNQVAVIVQNNIKELISVMNRYPVINISTPNQSLEEIFMQYYGGTGHDKLDVI